MKNKKDGGRNAKNFFWLSNAFSGNFLRPGYPSRVQVKFKGTAKNPVFIAFLGLKDCGGFKGRREMSRYQVVPFAISGCNLSAKVYASDFLVGFQREKPSEIR